MDFQSNLALMEKNERATISCIYPSIRSKEPAIVLYVSGLHLLDDPRLIEFQFNVKSNSGMRFLYRKSSEEPEEYTSAFVVIK